MDVPLGRCDGGEILGIELEHETFRDDNNPIATSRTQPLDDGAHQRVDDVAQAAPPTRKLLGDEGKRRPAAFPIPRARWPALRPIAITKYQREVVLASTIKFLTISTP